MRIITVFLSLCLFASPAVAADIKAEFTKAYKAYNAAVEDGDKDQILATAKKAYEVGLMRFGENNINTGGLALNYGNALLEKWKNKEAAKVLTASLEIYEKEYGENSINLIDPLFSLADAESQNLEKNAGVYHLLRVSELIEKNLGKENDIYFETQLKIGIRYYSGNAGNRQKYALEKVKNAHAWFLKKYGAESSFTASASHWVGRVYLQRKKYNAAVKSLNEALLGLDSSKNSRHRLAMSTHAFLVNAYEGIGDDEKAAKHCQLIGQINPSDSIDGALPIYKVAPKYPRAMAMKGREASVVVSFTVDKNGETKDIKVIEEESKGDTGFYQASIEAVKQFRYAPRYQNGEFLETKGVLNRLSFKLED